MFARHSPKSNIKSVKRPVRIIEHGRIFFLNQRWMIELTLIGKTQVLFKWNNTSTNFSFKLSISLIQSTEIKLHMMLEQEPRVNDNQCLVFVHLFFFFSYLNNVYRLQPPSGPSSPTGAKCAFQQGACPPSFWCVWVRVFPPWGMRGRRNSFISARPVCPSLKPNRVSAAKGLWMKANDTLDVELWELRTLLLVTPHGCRLHWLTFINVLPLRCSSFWNSDIYIYPHSVLHCNLTAVLFLKVHVVHMDHQHVRMLMLHEDFPLLRPSKWIIQLQICAASLALVLLVIKVSWQLWTSFFPLNFWNYLLAGKSW